LVSIGAISYEALRRILHPEPLPGNVIAIVAGVGIIVNGVTALMFMKEKGKDLNIKGAYLHLLADAAVSAALVVGGIIIIYTGWFWLDPMLSLLIALVILFSTWGLLRDSLRLSLDGVPRDIDLQKVKDEAIKIKGIERIHHVHVWAMSTTENAMTAHLVIDQEMTAEMEVQAKNNFRHAMEHLNIQHVTLETEK
jgi:cobalt-zinc-cadmium efflux system protein